MLRLTKKRKMEIKNLLFSEYEENRILAMQMLSKNQYKNLLKEKKEELLGSEIIKEILNGKYTTFVQKMHPLPQLPSFVVYHVKFTNIPFISFKLELYIGAVEKVLNFRIIRFGYDTKVNLNLKDTDHDFHQYLLNKEIKKDYRKYVKNIK